MNRLVRYTAVAMVALLVGAAAVADEIQIVDFLESDYLLTSEEGKTRIVTGVNVGMGQPGYPTGGPPVPGWG
ncbi:MAG: hypothetical protein GY867_09875 [bacterium]|nr:hypothetical protein [bacterium]